ITSGYDENSDNGQIVAVDIATGNTKFQFDLGAKGEILDYYSPTSPAAVDSDDDGYLDLIYVGDTNGVLWKIYFNPTTLDWSCSKLCETNSDQSITAKPLLVFDKSNATSSDRKLRVFFGTGRLMIEKDKFDPLTKDNSFYCIVEEEDGGGHYSSASVNVGALIDITQYDTETELEGYFATGNDIYNSFYGTGWKFNLSDLDERVVTDPTCVAGVVYFTSFNLNAPTKTFCGTSRLYAVDYETGVEPRYKGLPVIEFTEDKETEHNSHPRYADLSGNGIAWAPQLIHDTDSKGTSLVIRKADGTNEVIPLNTKHKDMWLKSWKLN
ncbi:MAG: hypothetical protein V1753_05285, partial [Pseudomonadota bacterium]